MSTKQFIINDQPKTYYHQHDGKVKKAQEVIEQITAHRDSIQAAAKSDGSL